MIEHMKTQSKQKMRWRKILASMLVLILCFEMPLWSYTPGTIETPLSANSLREQNNFLQAVSYLPQSILSQEDAQKKNSVLHILDAHADYEAQKEIAVMLEDWTTNRKIKAILVEGASSSLSSEPFEIFDDAKLNEILMDRLMQMGRVSGVESFLLQHTQSGETKIPILGIERPSKYQSNYKLFQSVMQETSLAQYIAEKADNIIQSLVDQIRDAAQRQLMRLTNAWENEHDLVATLRAVSPLAKRYLNQDLEDAREQLAYPYLVQLHHLLRKEKEIDWSKVQKDLQDLDRFLAAKEQASNIDVDSLRSALKNLQSTIESHENLESYNRSFWEKVSGSLLEEGRSLSDYPELSIWIRGQILRLEMDVAKSSDEMDIIISLLASLLMQEPEAKASWDLQRDLNLWKKLVVLELTSEKWKQVQMGLAPLLPQRLAKRIQQSLGLPLSEIENFNRDQKRLFALAIQFYRSAQSRDQVFGQAVKAFLADGRDGDLIVISGGFHGDSLQKKMSQRDLDYSQHFPRGATGNRDHYLKIMLAETKKTELAALSQISPPIFSLPIRIITEDLVKMTGSDRAFQSMAHAVRKDTLRLAIANKVKPRKWQMRIWSGNRGSYRGPVSKQIASSLGGFQLERAYLNALKGQEGAILVELNQQQDLAAWFEQNHLPLNVTLIEIDAPPETYYGLRIVSLMTADQKASLALQDIEIPDEGLLLYVSSGDYRVNEELRPDILRNVLWSAILLKVYSWSKDLEPKLLWQVHNQFAADYLQDIYQAENIVRYLQVFIVEYLKARFKRSHGTAIIGGRAWEDALHDANRILRETNGPWILTNQFQLHFNLGVVQTLLNYLLAYGPFLGTKSAPGRLGEVRSDVLQGKSDILTEKLLLHIESFFDPERVRLLDPAQPITQEVYQEFFDAMGALIQSARQKQLHLGSRSTLNRLGKIEDLFPDDHANVEGTRDPPMAISLIDAEGLQLRVVPAFVYEAARVIYEAELQTESAKGERPLLPEAREVHYQAFLTELEDRGGDVGMKIADELRTSRTGFQDYANLFQAQTNRIVLPRDELISMSREDRNYYFASLALLRAGHHLGQQEGDEGLNGQGLIDASAQLMRMGQTSRGQLPAWQLLNNYGEFALSEFQNGNLREASESEVDRATLIQQSLEEYEQSKQLILVTYLALEKEFYQQYLEYIPRWMGYRLNREMIVLNDALFMNLSAQYGTLRETVADDWALTDGRFPIEEIKGAILDYGGEMYDNKRNQDPFYFLRLALSQDDPQIEDELGNPESAWQVYQLLRQGPSIGSAFISEFMMKDRLDALRQLLRGAAHQSFGLDALDEHSLIGQVFHRSNPIFGGYLQGFSGDAQAYFEAFSEVLETALKLIYEREISVEDPAGNERWLEKLRFLKDVRITTQPLAKLDSDEARSIHADFLAHKEDFRSSFLNLERAWQKQQDADHASSLGKGSHAMRPIHPAFGMRIHAYVDILHPLVYDIMEQIYPEFKIGKKLSSKPEVKGGLSPLDDAFDQYLHALEMIADGHGEDPDLQETAQSILADLLPSVADENDQLEALIDKSLSASPDHEVSEEAWAAMLRGLDANADEGRDKAREAFWDVFGDRRKGRVFYVDEENSLFELSTQDRALLFGKISMIVALNYLDRLPPDDIRDLREAVPKILLNLIPDTGILMKDLPGILREQVNAWGAKKYGKLIWNTARGAPFKGRKGRIEMALNALLGDHQTLPPIWANHWKDMNLNFMKFYKHAVGNYFGRFLAEDVFVTRPGVFSALNHMHPEFGRREKMTAPAASEYSRFISNLEINEAPAYKAVSDDLRRFRFMAEPAYHVLVAHAHEKAFAQIFMDQTTLQRMSGPQRLNYVTTAFWEALLKTVVADGRDLRSIVARIHDHLVGLGQKKGQWYVLPEPYGEDIYDYLMNEMIPILLNDDISPRLIPKLKKSKETYLKFLAEYEDQFGQNDASSLGSVLEVAGLVDSLVDPTGSLEYRQELYAQLFPEIASQMKALNQAFNRHPKYAFQALSATQIAEPIHLMVTEDLFVTEGSQDITGQAKKLIEIARRNGSITFIWESQNKDKKPALFAELIRQANASGVKVQDLKSELVNQRRLAQLIAGQRLPTLSLELDKPSDLIHPSATQIRWDPDLLATGLDAIASSALIRQIMDDPAKMKLAGLKQDEQGLWHAGTDFANFLQSVYAELIANQSLAQSA